jgi:RNA polymerase sigma-70 factor (ECF subfamily)
VDQRDLVERAGRGDHEAFALLTGASVARLEAVARLTLRDSGLAQDAVQEALVRAWRNLPGLRDPDRFDAWLHRLIINSCIDVVRIRRRRPIEVERAPYPSNEGDWVALIADRDQLHRGFRRLSVDQRAALVLQRLPWARVDGPGAPVETAHHAGLMESYAPTFEWHRTTARSSGHRSTRLFSGCRSLGSIPTPGPSRLRPGTLSAILPGSGLAPLVGEGRARSSYPAMEGA